MGCDSIRYTGACLGFAIESGELLNFGTFQSHDKVYEETRLEMAKKLNNNFKAFLKRKYGGSIPKEYSKMKFILDYDELIAEYEVSPYDYPKLVYGYYMKNFIGKKAKDLHSITETNLPRSFPKNCANVLAEFLAENKFKQDRQNKKPKISKNSDSKESVESDEEEESEESDEYEEGEESEEDEESEAENDSDSESESEDLSDEELPVSEIKKLKETLMKELSYGLHGFVH